VTPFPMTSSAADYGFLTHDSFVNCAEPVRRFSESEIRGQLLADLGRIRGRLGATTIAEIIRAVQNATTISPYHKSLIFRFLAGVFLD